MFITDRLSPGHTTNREAEDHNVYPHGPTPGLTPGSTPGSTREHRTLNSAPCVAIVGATGAVGQEFLKVLTQRQFPVGNLKLLASGRSAGRMVAFRDRSYRVEQLVDDSFKGIDLALFSAGSTASKAYAPIASAAGATVIDNSSAFRMSDGVPLVVPEVNPEAVKGVQLGQGGIIANPNCSTIILLVPVTPLHRAAGVTRMVVSTYQAASGAGAAAIAELELQTREVLEGKPPTCEVFSQQYAFNLFSHDSQVQPNGYNAEEMKIIQETHKIWGQPKDDTNVAITATCVRVPVMRAHAESINLTFKRPLDPKDAQHILQNAPGVSVIHDPTANRFPTPIDASGRDDVLVGRIRRDISLDQTEGIDGLDLFVCGDQLRKGAALNAVQIAELLL